MTRKSKEKNSSTVASHQVKRRKLKFLADMEPKRMIVYPLVVFIVALIVLAVHFPQLGIDLKGGVVVTVYGVNVQNTGTFAKELSAKLGVPVRVESFKGINVYGIRVYAPAGIDPQKIIGVLKKVFPPNKYPNVSYSHTEVLPTFGKVAQAQGIRAIVYAFIGMAFVVFIFFRNPVSSLAIIFSAFSDMVIAVASMGLLGVQLTTATIAALLMLIGYTVDSNILLTTKLVKQRVSDLSEAYLSAVSTGFTMSTTTLGALVVLYVVTTSDVIRNIAIVLIFGLLADFMNTWIFNAGVLRWYLGKKARGGK